MRVFSIILLLLLSAFVSGQSMFRPINAYKTFAGEGTYEEGYYVSNDGDDGNTGVSPSDAWETIGKVNSTSFSPGDNIFFKAGDVFDDTVLIISDSGTSGNPITYDSYGSGDKPIISGFTEVTGWSDEGGGVYSKTVSTESNPEIVTIDGVQYAMGRTPNADRYNNLSSDYYHIDNNIAGTVTSVADYSGTVAGTILITTSAAHTITTGDFITLSLSPTTPVNYNGNYTATVVNSTQFYVTKTYGATATGTAYNNMQINDSECDAAVTDWDTYNAELIIRSSNKFRWTKAPITDHTGTKLIFGNATPDPITADYGYFIQNDIRTLDQFGEWFYDGTDLYVYFGGETPDDYTVKVSAIDDLIDLDGESYITVQNLSFEGANGVAVSTKLTANSNNLTIHNCDFDFNNEAIWMNVTTDATITYNSIIRSSRMGVYMHNRIDAVYFAHNTIDSTGLIIGAGLETGTNFEAGIGAMLTWALRIESDSIGIIEYNTVLNSGYQAINFSGDSMIVRNNFVSNFCLNKSDGGGIYHGSNSYYYHLPNNLVEKNIVMNGFASDSATGLPSDEVYNNSPAIYIDHDSPAGFIISENVITNTEKGVHFHATDSATIIGNLIYDCDYGISLYGTVLGDPDFTEMLIEDNQVISKDSGQLIFYARNNTSVEAYMEDIGDIDTNYYVSPVNWSNNFSILVGTWDDNYNPIATWQGYGHDENTTTYTWHKNNSDSIFFDYYIGDSTKTVALSGTWMKPDSTEITSYQLTPFTGIVAFKDTIEAIELDEIYAAYPLNGNANDSVASQDGTVQGAVATTGKFGAAYDFDASDRIFLPLNLSSLTSNSISISMWIKLDQTAATLGYPTRIYSELLASFAVKIDAKISTGNTLELGVRNTANTEYVVTSAAGAFATTGVWYHVVMNIPDIGETGEIYINGSKSTGTTNQEYAGTLRESDWRQYIGTYTAAIYAIDGITDEVVIFNRWLTAGEANYIYDSGTGKTYPY